MIDLDGIQTLLNSIAEHLKNEKHIAQSGEQFNCFDICRIGNDELRHSSIVAAMLDPQGSHGLGNGPLKAFFSTVGCSDLVEKCDDCSVETEYSIEHRRMDIVIRNRNLCVVIENKTATVDHYMQLKDYREWLEEQPVSLKKLFYLTYHGDYAVDENIGGDEYSAISCKKDICSWMLKCAHLAFEKNLPAVQAFCHQYYTYLKQITEASMTQDEMNKLKAIILRDPSNFKSAREIADNFPQIRKAALDDLLTGWAADRIAFNGLPEERDLCLKCERDRLVYAFGFSSHNFRNFYYGIRWADCMAHPVDNNRFPPMDGWQQNDWFPYSKYFDKEFKNPDDEILYDEDKKFAFLQRLDKAMEEMKNLIKKTK